MGVSKATLTVYSLLRQMCMSVLYGFLYLTLVDPEWLMLACSLSARLWQLLVWRQDHFANYFLFQWTHLCIVTCVFELVDCLRSFPRAHLSVGKCNSFAFPDLRWPEYFSTLCSHLQDSHISMSAPSVRFLLVQTCPSRSLRDQWRP